MRIRRVRAGAAKTGDQAEFERALRGVASEFGSLASVFQPGPLWAARAPGRLDLMGGISDYSGGLVCEWPLEEATWVALQPRADDRLLLVTTFVEPGLVPRVELALSGFYSGRRLKTYAQVRSFFDAGAPHHWAAYVAGVLFVLLAEGRVERWPHGATIGVASRVPAGAGVASSAALEVATMQAVCAAYGIGLNPLDKALLCQKAENLVAGAPCGLMDQLTAVLGEDGAALVLLCQPHQVRGHAPFPEGVQVAGIDSGVKHAVGGSRYTETRVGAFMGHRIIEEHMMEIAPGRRSDPLNGYLCNVDPEELSKVYAPLLPAQMQGADFLARYGDTVDPVTTVDPERAYRVRSRVEHMVLERARVERFLKALEIFDRTRDARFLGQAGEQMYGSHWSYGHRCGMGAAETDLLVRLARAEAPQGGVFGAKITGGGSGGTVALLGNDSLPAAVERIVARYAEAVGRAPAVFLGSSVGAEAFGWAEYELTG